jgi:hypothetical protein
MWVSKALNNTPYSTIYLLITLSATVSQLIITLSMSNSTSLPTGRGVVILFFLLPHSQGAETPSLKFDL